jgi:transposase
MTAPIKQPAYLLFVAIDIAAATFTASTTTGGSPSERARTFAQTPEGFAALQAQLRATGVAPAQTLCVVEATGSYWVALAVTLHEAQYVVSVVNPAQAHNYAKSLPRRSKMDVLDAPVLAQFAAERKPSPWTPPPTIYHELRQRLMTRDALLEMRQQARRERHALLQWPIVIEAVKAQLDGVIADLSGRLAALESEIAQVLEDGAWADEATLLLSITGLGLITTAWLLVGTMNFQACASAEKASAYVGLVPLAHESGSSVRGRAQIGHGGHTRLRTALYLATLSAARFNPVIKTYYDRLRAAGKPMKVARCAAARKLLHLAWAIVTKRQPFDPAYRERLAEERLAA